jgi:nucleoside diphosphate kinase
MKQTYASALESLSVLDEKRHMFLMDADFREGCDHFHHLGGEALHDVHDLASVLFKPDAVLTGQAVRAADAIADQGFRPVAVRVLDVHSSTVRTLWRYQLRYASVDRVLAFDDFFRLGPSVFVLYRADPHHVPASVRLSHLKGSTVAANRTADTLRSRLVSPNRLFSLLHTADEPADVIRELAVLFDRPARRAILRESGVAGATAPSVTAAVEEALRQAGGSLRTFAPHAACAAALRDASSADCPDTGDHACYSCVREAVRDRPDVDLWCRLVWSADRLAFNNDELRFVRLFGKATPQMWTGLRPDPARGERGGRA